MRSRPLPTVRMFVLAGVLGVSLAGCAGAPEPATPAAVAAEPGWPVEVSSCGHTTTLASPPKEAVTLNQGATEVMLALGLEDRMAGTAYLDDEVAPAWRTEYDGVPVLSPEYPTREELLAVRPDFVYASYASAFEPKVAGTQDELAGSGIGSYLSPFGCAEEDQAPALSLEAVWAELDAVGRAFGVPDRAEALRRSQQATLDELAAQDAGAGRTALWYDSGRKAPLVGAGDGGPALAMEAVELENVFADLDGGWTEATWEKVVAADPDVIVLADASWDSAADKIAYLERDPVLGRLTAVREHRFVTVPYSESTPGVRLVDGAVSVADQLPSATSGIEGR